MRKVGPVTKTLINAHTFAANNNITIDPGLITGISWINDPVFHLKLVENSGSSNMQCFLQASDDGGTSYGNMITFTDATASGNEYLCAKCSNTVAQLSLFGDKFKLQHVQNAAGNWTITLKVSGMASMGSGS